jgi:hypothetical protein
MSTAAVGLVLSVLVPTCKTCQGHLKKGKLPPFSMAKENYGTPQNLLGMECFKLSALSKNMMFLVRGYAQVVELSTITGKPQTIRGSMIHFDTESVIANHDSTTQLPRANAEELMQLHLLGPKGRIDRIKKSLGGDMRSPVRVDASYNMKYLAVMQACNPLYKVVNILETNDGVAFQETTVDKVLNRAIVDPDPETESVSNAASSSATIPNGQEYISGLDETLLYKRDISIVGDASPRAVFLAAALRMFKGKDSSKKSENDGDDLVDTSESTSAIDNNRPLDSITRLSRAENPLNEFERADLQRLFAGRFSDLFFLGQAFKDLKGTPSMEKIDHLLHFYDNRFCCNEFVLFLADMLERHEVAVASKGKLMNSLTTRDLVKNNYLDGSIIPRLEVEGRVDWQGY